MVVSSQIRSSSQGNVRICQPRATLLLAGNIVIDEATFMISATTVTDTMLKPKTEGMVGVKITLYDLVEDHTMWEED